MSKGGPVTKAEEKAIREALEGGMSQTKAAKEFDRSKRTIHRISKRGGISSKRLPPKKAIESHKYRARAARAAVAAEIIDEGRKWLKGKTSKEYRDGAVGVAVGLDKLRLELPSEEQEHGGEIAELFQKMRAEEASR